jgi:hypothetical protein
MPEQNMRARFTEALFLLLDETFEHHHGIYLDKDTSLFQTLEGITAEEASHPVSEHCATLAAQVKHLTFYLTDLQDYFAGKAVGKVDWGEIWRTTQEVNPEEWEALRRQLRATYGRVRATLQNVDGWDGEDEIGGALAILAHTAYHLGEIRQALCVIK